MTRSAPSSRPSNPAQEGIGHVAGRPDGREPVFRRWKDFRDPSQVFRQGFHLRPSPVQKAEAQGRGHADPTVVGAAAPQAQQDAAGPTTGGIQQQLPHPPGGGVQGVLPSLDQGQPRGGGHLHHRAAVRQQAVARLYRVPKRARHPDRRLCAAGQAAAGVHQALSAVGHGQLHHLRPGAEAADGPGLHPAHLPGAEGPLKGVRSQYDPFHLQSSLTARLHSCERGHPLHLVRSRSIIAKNSAAGKGIPSAGAPLFCSTRSGRSGILAAEAAPRPNV